MHLLSRKIVNIDSRFNLAKPLTSLQVHPQLMQYLHERLLRSARLPFARPTMT